MLAPLKVFCCYAREDQEMLIELQKHLAPLRLQGQITIWSDTNINAGAQWKKELYQHLESADLILLLISPDFLASEYCYSIEMMRAIERHNEGSTLVIPILLRATFWQNAPFAKLQIVPRNAKPVMSWPDRDDAFHDIAMQVSRVVSELRNRMVQKTKEQWILEGKEHYDVRQYDEALVAYKNALDLDSDNELVRETVGHILIQLERYDEALTIYDDLLRSSSSASAYLFKGLVLQRMGKSLEALAAYQKAREYGYSG